MIIMKVINTWYSILATTQWVCKCTCTLEKLCAHVSVRICICAHVHVHVCVRDCACVCVCACVRACVTHNIHILYVVKQFHLPSGGKASLFEWVRFRPCRTSETWNTYETYTVHGFVWPRKVYTTLCYWFHQLYSKQWVSHNTHGDLLGH